ncbi:unnamed protein product [Clavelina lepadiformis]|uniref:Folate receptor-like domain-containing protein n=1 Tax=Clavelina lepadiformis TaxID=159417 RepID=A0ABP0FRC1_CLALP
MGRSLSFFVVFLSFCWLVNTQSRFTTPTTDRYTSPTCPKTNYGKDEPSKEENLYACKQYQCQSCCGENITMELAQVPLQQIGNVNMDQCSEKHHPLSGACSDEWTYIECFYQCSPNLFPWIGPLKKLHNIPICAKFCDNWFNLCAADYTCVAGEGNWLTGLDKGFNEDGTAKNPCKGGVSCRNYTQVYGSGEKLCNTVWGDLFKYTTDEEHCVDPSDIKHNLDFVKSLNPSYEVNDCTVTPVSYTDAGVIVGIVFGVLAGLLLIAAGVYYFMQRKKANDQPSKKDQPKTEEMTTLRTTSQPAKENPDTPPNTRDQSDVEEA